MRKYEIMYILNATLDDAARKSEMAKLNDILAANKIQLVATKEWGLRDFAYPIKKQTKGYYVILTVNGDNAGLAEFERLVKLNQNVLRYLVTLAQN